MWGVSLLGDDSLSGRDFLYQRPPLPALAPGSSQKHENINHCLTVKPFLCGHGRLRNQLPNV